jgi:5-methylcytosine-specific restriction endonuclease McrA
MLKTCAVCGRLIPGGRGARCEAHRVPHKRSGTYTRNAKLVVAGATHCGICGKPRWPGDVNTATGRYDPLVADHIVPRGRGGSDALVNLRPAHKSCNGRRGQALGEAGGLYV